MTKWLIGFLILFFLAGFGLSECKSQRRPDIGVAVIQPFSGTKTRGVVRFIPEHDRMRVQGKITGLAPGWHGFHVHQLGDCSSPDGLSAGGHFNPTLNHHGNTHGSIRHAGDLGNIHADMTGTATFNKTVPEISFSGDGSIIGRSVIVHAKKDDLVSQPTGGSGARVGGGVIGRALE